MVHEVSVLVGCRKMVMVSYLLMLFLHVW